MSVKIFDYKEDYSNWVNNSERMLNIISVVVFDDSLVVTYTVK